LKRAAIFVLAVIYLTALGSPWLAPYDYSEQLRHLPDRPPSPGEGFVLGTDELGRDRFSRLLYGSCVSLLLAPAAAILATALALTVGLIAGYFGGWAGRTGSALIDLFLAIPWILLLLLVRATLPLNLPGWASVSATFAVLGLLGWAHAARVVRASVRSLCGAPFLLQARAQGASLHRIWIAHLLPNLRPVLAAQFLVITPLLILGEANLGMLGLGVTEPLPSWGNLLAELTHVQSLDAGSWPVLAPKLAPAALLFVVLLCYYALSPKEGQVT
jgi:ABC-type dipeptide/oligopeptide/nickel transport system permease subunit